MSSTRPFSTVPSNASTSTFFRALPAGRGVASSSHADEWFNTYCICLAGEPERCGHAILRDMWDGFHDDLVECEQRWHCNVCSVRYKGTWGVLCEIFQDGSLFYWMAHIPKGGIECAKQMKLQTRVALRTLPKAKPFGDGPFLTEVDGKQGCYKLNMADFRIIGHFDWAQLYYLFPGMLRTGLPRPRARARGKPAPSSQWTFVVEEPPRAMDLSSQDSQEH